MKTMRFKGFLLLLCSVLLSMGGCTTFNAFPVKAMSGETVTLAVGSPDDMNRDNTTAIFTSDSDGIPVDITSNIRSIFKLYADKASVVYQAGASMQSIVETSGHEPWLTVAVIDLPIGLGTGPGHVEFSTTASYPTVGSHINTFPIGLEILPGTGSPTVFDYELGLGAMAVGNLADLEPQPRAELGPSFPSVACPCPDYGAIEVKFNLPNSLGEKLNQAFVRVLADDMTVKSGSGRSMVYGMTGDDVNKDLDVTVTFLSPTGQLKYYEARFAVVLHQAATFSGPPTIESIRYFALDGSEVSGPVADYNVALKN